MNRLQHEPKKYVLAMSCHTTLYNLASGIDLHLQSAHFLLENDVGLNFVKESFISLCTWNYMSRVWPGCNLIKSDLLALAQFSQREVNKKAILV